MAEELEPGAWLLSTHMVGVVNRVERAALVPIGVMMAELEEKFATPFSESMVKTLLRRYDILPY